MEHKDLLYFLQHVGTDPSRLIFEDDLTGIYNRRFLLNYLQHKVSWDSLESRTVSLLMMDLDYFKEINDTYGHGVGDKALIWVAGLVKKLSGDKGLAIRYGGDEFMILLPGADKESALKVGEALMQQIHNDSSGRQILRSITPKDLGGIDLPVQSKSPSRTCSPKQLSIN
jgi:diguanylate cyclase (GGDEF)-like protein